MASLVVFIALHLEGTSFSDETLFQSSTGDTDRLSLISRTYKTRMLKFFTPVNIALTLEFTTELHHFRYHGASSLAMPIAQLSIICTWHWETFCFLPLPRRSPYCVSELANQLGTWSCSSPHLLKAMLQFYTEMDIFCSLCHIEK